MDRGASEAPAVAGCRRAVCRAGRLHTGLSRDVNTSPLGEGRLERAKPTSVESVYPDYPDEGGGDETDPRSDSDDGVGGAGRSWVRLNTFERSVAKRTPHHHDAAGDH